MKKIILLLAVIALYVACNDAGSDEMNPYKDFTKAQADSAAKADSSKNMAMVKK